jgi:hypothetical protein
MYKSIWLGRKRELSWEAEASLYRSYGVTSLNSLPFHRVISFTIHHQKPYHCNHGLIRSIHFTTPKRDANVNDIFERERKKCSPGMSHTVSDFAAGERSKSRLRRLGCVNLGLPIGTKRGRYIVTIHELSMSSDSTRLSFPAGTLENSRIGIG